ncbi:hypothetical protein BG015_006134, partial [Linnemannia schmuckeri]
LYTDEYIIYRKDHEASIKQQKLVKKLKEAAQRKGRTENSRKAKVAAEEALTLKQSLRRQVKARRKELTEKAYQLVPNITAPIHQQVTYSKPKHKFKHVIMDQYCRTTPEDQGPCIRLDNQTVVKQFRDAIVNRKRASVRMKLRCVYAAEWAVVARICNERTGITTVEWVKGHDGDKWNEKMDRAAKEAQSQTEQVWEFDRSAQDDIKYLVTMAGKTLDQDTRHVLKMQTTRRWHPEWRALKRTKRSIPIYKGTDWLGTLSNIHNKNQSIPSSALGRIHVYAATG